MPRKRKIINLDYTAIEAALNSGNRVDLKELARTHGTCPPVIRRVLTEYYGEKISFKPGRNGGIRWNNPTSVSATTAATVVTEPETASVA
jgi:DNA-binding IscR family transcriptional regulator